MTQAIPQIDNTPAHLSTPSVQIVSDPQPSRASAGDDMRHAIACGDVLGSARTRDGAPLAHSEITSDAIVTVRVEGKPMEMRVIDAERFGFIAKTGDNYSATTNQQNQPKPEAPPMEQPEGPELFNGEQEQLYVNLTTGIPSTLHSRMTSEWIKDGSVSEALLREVASAVPGSDPEVIKERIGRTVELFADQAHASIAAQGFNSEAVLAWADQNHPEVLNQAMETQATSRSTKGFQKLVGLYLENLDTVSPKKLLAMKFPDGVTLRSTLNGKIMVDAHGGSMSWAEAVKYKIVRFRGVK